MLAALAYPLLALAFLLIEIAIVRLWRKRRAGAYVLAFLPSFGFILDAATLALGAAIGAGAFLASLNWHRYLAHGILTPLFFVFAVHLAREAGLRRTERLAFGLGWGLAASLMTAGLLSALQLKLEPRAALGVLRYVEDRVLTPAWAGAESLLASILLILVYLGLGAIIWKKTAWPWLFLGSLAAFLANAVPGQARFLMSSLGELTWLLAVLATAARLGSTPADRARAGPALA